MIERNAARPKKEYEDMIQESLGKVKIALDENLSDAVPVLRELGRTVDLPDPGSTDRQVHQWLLKQNFTVFFTANTRDFKEFLSQRPKYILVDCDKMKPWHHETKANAIHQWMRKHYQQAFTHKQQNGSFVAVLNNDIFKK